jgi:hypothetical protein
MPPRRPIARSIEEYCEKNVTGLYFGIRRLNG